MMGALRDAAARGVRVLVDDLHTAGADLPLLGSSAHDGVDVRLFNPFSSDGTLRWAYGDSDVDEGYEPDTDFWSCFLLDPLSPFVPEQML